MANEKQDKATSLYISFVMSWLWHKRDAQWHILHRVVYFFLTVATTTVIVSFDFRLTIPGKNLEHAQNA